MLVVEYVVLVPWKVVGDKVIWRGGEKKGAWGDFGRWFLIYWGELVVGRGKCRWLFMCSCYSWSVDDLMGVERMGERAREW